MGLSNIYALCDPLDGRIRYVGKTCRKIAVRHWEHIKFARAGKRTHLYNWLRSLPDQRPLIIVLEIVPVEDDCAAERRWIAKLKAEGATLTNGTDGGEGSAGRVVKDETRQKISAANKGKKLSDEHKQILRSYAQNDDVREKLRVAGLGRKQSPEAIEKSRLGRIGQKRTEEQKAKFRAVQLGKKASDEAKANMAAYQRGKKHSEETKAKMSASHKGRTFSAETKVKMSKARQGITMSAETRARMTQAKLDYWAAKRAAKGAI